jgi:hypothetical protein
VLSGEALNNWDSLFEGLILVSNSLLELCPRLPELHEASASFFKLQLSCLMIRRTDSCASFVIKLFLPLRMWTIECLGSHSHMSLSVAVSSHRRCICLLLQVTGKTSNIGDRLCELRLRHRRCRTSRVGRRT